MIFAAGEGGASLQCAGEIDPVEAQDHVGGAQDFGAVRRQGVRGADMERMIGRESARRFSDR